MSRRNDNLKKGMGELLNVSASYLGAEEDYVVVYAKTLADSACGRQILLESITLVRSTTSADLPVSYRTYYYSVLRRNTCGQTIWLVHF